MIPSVNICELHRFGGGVIARSSLVHMTVIHTSLDKQTHRNGTFARDIIVSESTYGRTVVKVLV